MNEFGFLSATMTVFYQTGLDDFNEPVIKTSTYRNVTNNVSAAQVEAVAQAIVGLSDYEYIESVKTQKEVVGK